MSLFSAHQTKDESEEFWKIVELNQGPVLAYGIAKYVAQSFVGEESAVSLRGSTMRWGLCYVTDQGVFFYSFPQQSMLGGLLGKSKEQALSFGISFENVDSWKSPPRIKNLWQRMIKRQERTLAIEGAADTFYLREKSFIKESTLDRETYLFTLDFSEEKILAALQEKIPAKEQVKQ